MEECICKNCGKTFLGRTAKQCFYCCDECKKEYKKNHFITYNHICDFCGKEFKSRTKTVQGKHCFCSRECYFDFCKKKAREIRKCEICGKEFECSKKSSQRFCSIQCQCKWQTFSMRGKNNGHYNSNFTEEERHKPCEWCGKVFEIKRFDKYKPRFCSQKCRQEWYANVWSQNPKWKQDSRERAVKILEKGCISKVYTAPQKKVIRYIEELNIDYNIEKNCKYYSLDIYIPNKKQNFGIEIMGTFWHCDRRKYDKVKYENQYKRIISDKRKRTYIQNQYNIPILYLWEDDIDDKKLCQQLIQYYIKNNGIIPNYHSFNYYIQNNKIKLKTNIIKPYMELSPKDIIKGYEYSPTTTE